MLHILTHDILPVFSMLALGFLLGRAGTISREEAAAVNRVAFLVLQPALIFPLIAAVDFGAFALDAMAAYALSQAVAFGLAYGLAKRVFGRAAIEAWLLAMAVVFVNSLLYIWPISVLLYGSGNNMPITALVAWDASVTFAFFIISTDLMANRGAGSAKALKRVAMNPVLVAIAAGVLANLSALEVPQPVLTAAQFAGAGAAPLTLLALGVILSGQKIAPGPVVVAISGMKLLVFPAFVWVALSQITAPDNWVSLVHLNAAGPSGAMAFALAMLYRVRTDAIAPVIIWTSLLSLISLAALA